MEHLLPYLLDLEKEIAEQKDAARAKSFWLKIAWEVETCSEAAEVFPDMLMCPVCLEREVDGHVLHKAKASILN